MKRSVVRRSSMFGLAALVVLVGAAVVPASSVPDPGDPVPTLDLVFLMDGSGSIDSNDWTLQKQGYAAALADEQNFPLGGNVSTATVQLVVTRVGTPPPGPGSDVDFGGFTEPVADGTRARAGSTIPFKWSLSGPDAEDAVASARFVADGATYAITRSGLAWHVNAKTPKAWSGTTQTFRVRLADGTVYDVEVSFT